MKKNKFFPTLVVLGLLFTAGVGSALAYQGDYSVKGPNSDPERHEAMQAALTNNDYAAWSELMDGRGRSGEIITAENFSKFAEAWRLAQAGDYEGADAIRQELGLRTRDGQGVGAGFHKEKGSRAGFDQSRGSRTGGMGRNFVDNNGDRVCDNLE